MHGEKQGLQGLCKDPINAWNNGGANFIETLHRLYGENWEIYPEEKDFQKMICTLLEVWKKGASYLLDEADGELIWLE